MAKSINDSLNYFQTLLQIVENEEDKEGPMEKALEEIKDGGIKLITDREASQVTIHHIILYSVLLYYIVEAVLY